MKVSHVVLTPDPGATDGPAASWQLESDSRNAVQSAFRVRVERQSGRGQASLWWDSGRCPGSVSLHVPYGGRPLAPLNRYAWRVQVWDGNGALSDWSDPAVWLEGPADGWHGAEWISAPVHMHLTRADSPLEPPPGTRRPAILEREVDVSDACDTAYLHVTSLGTHVVRINGIRADDCELAPGWTDYSTRVQYVTYDVAPFMRPGLNRIEIEVAAGWYAGRVGWGSAHYGEQPAVLALLAGTNVDGASWIVATDDHWTARESHVLWADIIDGFAEGSLTRLPAPSTRVTVRRLDIRVERHRGSPVRRLGRRAAVAVRSLEADKHVFDVGVNLSGFSMLKGTATAAGFVHLRHGEVVDSEGDLYTENLRTARCTDSFFVDAGPFTVEPRHTYRGFRYVQVTGPLARPATDDLTAVVIGDDIRRVGRLQTDNDLVNKLVEIIDRGLRSNLVSIPTDCPQRDERLGWSADLQLILPSAAWLYDMSGVVDRWSTSLRDGQTREGAFPDVAPVAFRDLFAEGAPGWGDAGVIVPWTAYLRYGDHRRLAEAWPSMRAWIAFVTDANPDLIWRHRRGQDYGDWLNLGADTDHELVASAYLAHSLRIGSRAARVLGIDEAAGLEVMAERAAASFRARYLTGEGLLTDGTQTACVLALAFGLVKDRAVVAEQLARDIRARGASLTTGFHGVAHVLHVLADTGYDDLAYELLLRTEFPSWGYQLAHGATTVWERWDGVRPDGSFQNPQMNSFNHYALGSVLDWIFKGPGGLSADESAPGFTSVTVRPLLSPRVRSVDVEFESPVGVVGSSWAWDGHQVVGEVTIPANATAEVWVPTDEPHEVRESGRVVSGAVGVEGTGPATHRVKCSLGSGTYRFTAPVRG